MEGVPAPSISVGPCGEALSHADIKNLVCSRMCGTDGVPEVGERGPGPGILIFELGAGVQKKANYSNVADEESVV